MKFKPQKKSLFFAGAIVIALLAVIILLQREFPALNQNPKEPAYSKTKVNMGRSVTPGRALPILVAEKKGFFDKYNLDIKSQELMRGYQEALIAGELDVMNDGTATFLAAAVGGADIKIVGVTLQTEPYYLIGRKGLRPEDVSRVAINRFGGEGYYMTLNALRLWGVDITKLQFEASGTNEAQYALLIKNNVDIATFQPREDFLKVQKEFEKDGMQILFNITDDPKSYFPLALVTRSDFIKNNPETIKNILLALQVSIEFARLNKDETLKIIVDEYRVNETDANFIYENFLLSTQNLDMKPKLGFFQTLLEDMAIENKEALNYDINKYIDTTLIPKIL